LSAGRVSAHHHHHHRDICNAPITVKNEHYTSATYATLKYIKIDKKKDKNDSG